MEVSVFGQFKALLKKNVKLKRRAKKRLAMEIFYPLIIPAILNAVKLMMQVHTLSSIPFFHSRTLANTTLQYASSFIGRKILVTPNTAEIRLFAHETAVNVQQMLNLTSTPALAYYPDQNSMDTAYELETVNVIAGLVFYYDSSNNYSYAIRTPYVDAPDTVTYVTGQGQCRSGKGQDPLLCDANKYLKSGFCLLQAAVDAVFLRILTGNSSFPRPDISVQMMPRQPYKPSTKLFRIVSSICFVLGYSHFVPIVTSNIEAEQDKKIKRSMQMMGMCVSAFWLSWGLVHLFMAALSALFMNLFFFATSFFVVDSNSFFILFGILLLYGLSVITIGYVLVHVRYKIFTVRFIVSVMCIFCGFLYMVVGNEELRLEGVLESINTSTGVRLLVCICSPVALALAIDRAIFLDNQSNDGMNFKTITDGDFPLYVPMVMLLIDAVLYFLVAVYLDNILPGENGARQKPWYFLTRSYWFTKQRNRHPKLLPKVKYSHDEIEFVESVHEELREKTAVIIQDIQKVFWSGQTMVAALNGLSLDIYEGQITCLLGHNGAGKTTLFNILTGLMQPTMGTASILGLNIDNALDMQRIRSMTGVCPQQNILFDDMSCVEHLQLYGVIKGVPGDRLQDEAETTLRDIDLDTKRDILAKNLSSGEKRKLCVAIALIGDPKIIFLDEPTAGMDSYSRRHLWSVLKGKKKDRVILLITHLMDEADILADRKAVINKGKLRCCGSSLYLKTKFGIGYHLNMVIDDSCDVDQVTQLVKDCVSGGELHRIQRKELTYILPLNELPNFPVIFSALEKPKTTDFTTAQSLGIKQYSISMTSLEEVFLKIEEEDNSVRFQDTTLSKSRHQRGSLEGSSQHNSETMGRGAALSTPIADSYKLRSQQFWALFKIRFLLLIRDPRQILVLLLPNLIMIIGMLVAMFVTDTTPVPLFIDNASSKYARETAQSAAVPPLAVKDSINSRDSVAFMNLISSTFVTDNFTNTSELLSSYHMMGVQLDNYTITGSVLNIGFTVLFNGSAIHAMPAAINVMINHLLTALNLNHSLSVVNLPWRKVPSTLPYEQYSLIDYGVFVMAMATAVIIIPPSFAVLLVKDRMFKVKSQMRVTGLALKMYWGTTFCVDLLKYSIIISLPFILGYSLSPATRTYPGVTFTSFILCVCALPGNTLFSYLLSYLSTDPEITFAKTAFIYGAISFFSWTGLAVLEMNDWTNIALIIHYISLVLIPPYTSFRSWRYMRTVTLSANSGIAFSDDNSPEVFMSFFMPIVQCFLSFCLLRMLDIKKTGGNVWDSLPCPAKIRLAISPTNDNSIEHENEDVTTERRRVQNIKSNKENVAAFVENLGKKYTELKAGVSNATYAVKTGEIFGLLGPNGAGKSTILNMMVAELSHTEGQIVIGGYDIHSCMSEAFKDVGFCPAHDALWDVITLKEHIEFYASIRGVPKENIPILSDYFIQKMNLNEHKNKISKKLSGGTKRKLSFILGILGRPKLVLLDEPTTGMDPQSKCYVRDIIIDCFKDSERSVILTTHCMEEAENLADRVAILVNGKIKCLEEKEHLKDKYGCHYMLEMKLKPSDGNMDLVNRMEALGEEIKCLFPDATCREMFSERVNYTIPKSSVKSLATAFTALEQVKSRYSLEEYSLGQSTLEQVFLQFAKQQIDEDTTEQS